MTEFHFIRPLWLLSLLPLLALWWALWTRHSKQTQWSKLIPQDLLQHLLESSNQQRQRWPLIALLVAWVLAAAALAGPTWQKLPQPIHRSTAAVVIVMDLSPSMVAEDLKPSRLVRTRYKILDFLNQRNEGMTALVAYAGEAHVVSPLTDDNDTISNLVPALSPDVLPLTGSNVEMAIEKAQTLLADAGIHRGQILLFTDGIAKEAMNEVKKLIIGSPHTLSVIGVGSDDGAPIPTGNGGFTKDRQGNIVIAKLNSSGLSDLARSVGGSYSPLTTDTRDLDSLEEIQRQQAALSESQQVNREFDVWQDQGHWLAILLVPFALFTFRRGWVLSIAAVAFIFPQPSNAFEWQDLWATDDQQAHAAFESGDPQTAAEKFESRQWRGSAQYKSGDYAAAAKTFAEGKSVLDYYNLGNALLKQGAIDDAIEAYQTALDKDPKHQDAKANLELARSLKNQSQQNSSSDDQNQQSDQNGEQQQDGNSSSPKDGQENSDNGQADQSSKKSGENGQQNDNQNPESTRENTELADKSAESQSSNSSGEIDEEAAQQLAADDPTRQALSDNEKQQINNSDSSEPEEENESTAALNTGENDSQKNEEQSLVAQELTSQQGDSEKQQALEQWLRQIPDDPSGLLRRKFEYQHRQLRQQYRTGEWQPPENQAYERW
ncbi:VWA domain-containing protein [Aurantivibrio plasticivorans]